MDHHILIIEDDPDMGPLLQESLQEKSYTTHLATTGEQALAIYASHSIALIILDIMLPDTDGYALCQTLKQRSPELRVLMLTCRTLGEDIDRGFDSGTDDYLTKPYRMNELLARVKVLFTRKERCLPVVPIPVVPTPAVPTPAVPTPAGQTQLPGFSVDHEGHRLLDGQQQEVKLSPREFDLLLYFSAHPNKALTRDQILDDVWPEVVVGPRTVDAHVTTLKRKLKQAAKGELAFDIVSITRKGYRLTLS